MTGQTYPSMLMERNLENGGFGSLIWAKAIGSVLSLSSAFTSLFLHM